MKLAANNPIGSLYRRLAEVNLPKKYLKNRILPDWWDDKLAENPAGYSELLLILSRRLGLSLKTLREPEEKITFEPPGALFKKLSRHEGEDFRLCRVIAGQIAKCATLGFSNKFEGIPSSGIRIRDSILSRGAKWVGLKELAEYCWSVGIPVLHLNKFPRNTPRPDGFVTKHCGRPVIIICNGQKHPAWQLFILAHELGHIANNHLSDGDMIVDEKISDIDLGNQKDDLKPEELEANIFANEVLTGIPSPKINAFDLWDRAEILAKKLKMIGINQKIDPGHLALRIAHNNKNRNLYPLAQSVLKKVGNEKTGQEILHNQLMDNLDWGLMPNETGEFLIQMTEP